MYGSSPLGEWVPFANILQYFQDELTTFGCGGIMVQRLLRMMKRQTLEEHNERKGSHSNAG